MAQGWANVYDLAEAIASESGADDISVQQMRDRFIQDVYDRGGLGFLERVQKYGKTEQGETIKFAPWFLDALRLVGDFRIADVLITGAAQQGKTLAVLLCVADTLFCGKCNPAWFYDSLNNLNRNVKQQFFPIAETWLEAMGLDGWEPVYIGTKNTQRFAINGAYMVFSYVSTSAIGRGNMSGKAMAGAAAVSFQADMLVLEERSQYPPGAADPLPRRLDASKLQSRPVRELGTPGAGGGIEAVMAASDRHFYPHVQCPHCQSVIALDPKGCLLKQITVKDGLGRLKQSYFSVSDRPVSWHHKDPQNMIESAYIGCSVCGEEIPDEVRINARLKCVITGEWLSDFLDAMPSGIQSKRWTVAAHFTPLTREVQYNVAAEIIKSGIKAFSPTDWIQQGLGHSSSSEKVNVTHEMIRSAIAAPSPTQRPDYVLAGIDQGRSEDWMIIIAYYLPKFHERMLPSQISDKTMRRVLFCSAIERSQIPELLQRYGCSYGLIDNEPSRDTAMDICENTCLDMGNQIYRQINNNLTSGIVQDGGRMAECWTLNTNYFADALLNSFLMDADDGNVLMRLDEDWERHLNDVTPLSPVKHFCAPYRSYNGHWQRASDNVDDLFMAGVFAEAAFYLLINGMRNPKRTSPDRMYHFDYDLHVLAAPEVRAYGYKSTEPLYFSINWWGMAAIAIQIRKDGIFVLQEWQAESVEGLVQAIALWLGKIRCSSRLHFFGSQTEEQIPSWGEFQVACKKMGINGLITPIEPPPIVESVQLANRKITAGEIFVTHEAIALIKELDRESVWVEAGVLGGRVNLSECLRIFLWKQQIKDKAKIQVGSSPLPSVF